jgi:hypothetical protein
MVVDSRCPFEGITQRGHGGRLLPVLRRSGGRWQVVVPFVDQIDDSPKHDHVAHPAMGTLDRLRLGAINHFNHDAGRQTFGVTLLHAQHHGHGHGVQAVFAGDEDLVGEGDRGHDEIVVVIWRDTTAIPADLTRDQFVVVRIDPLIDKGGGIVDRRVAILCRLNVIRERHGQNRKTHTVSLSLHEQLIAAEHRQRQDQ